MAWIGKWLFAVGVIHSLFGIIFMRTTLSVLWSEGLLNTVDGQPAREAVFLVIRSADNHWRHGDADLRHLAFDPAGCRHGVSSPTIDRKMRKKWLINYMLWIWRPAWATESARISARKTAWR
jgi:hypothetical protein